MDSLLLYAQLLALLSLSAFCLYSIFLLIRVKDTLKLFRKNMVEVSERAIPVFDNMEYISSRVRDITDNIDDQVLLIHQSIGSIKQVADEIVEMERKIQSRVEGPILDGISFVAAVIKGVQTFASRIRG